jgi:ketosteroid isomerase-like protein
MKKTIPALLATAVFCSMAIAQKAGVMTSLVETEKAFAKTSVERGMREAFLAFFAEDGTNFTPHPVNTRQNLLSRPAPIPAVDTVLNWAPIFGDVSQAGDLGYTTGPYVLKEKTTEKVLRQGMFFSIWKKQADGLWRVVVDCGTKNSKPVAKLSDRFRPASSDSKSPASGGRDAQGARRALMEAEQGFLAEASSAGMKKAYQDYVHKSARLQRNEVAPRSGKGAIQDYLSRQGGMLKGELLHADVSQSCDLAYTYGSYELQGTGGPGEKGYFVRVWKRDSRNRWLIAVDIASPIPAERS